MAAANGTMSMVFAGGVRRTYSIYLDDMAGNPVRYSLDAKAGAASPDNIVLPLPSAIIDITIEAATAKTTTTIKDNDVPVSVILNANFLSTVTNRPVPGIVLGANHKLTMFQVT